MSQTDFNLCQAAKEIISLETFEYCKYFEIFTIFKMAAGMVAWHSTTHTGRQCDKWLLAHIVAARLIPTFIH